MSLDSKGWRRSRVGFGARLGRGKGIRHGHKAQVVWEVRDRVRMRGIKLAPRDSGEAVPQ